MAPISNGRCFPYVIFRKPGDACGIFQGLKALSRRCYKMEFRRDIHGGLELQDADTVERHHPAVFMRLWEEGRVSLCLLQPECGEDRASGGTCGIQGIKSASAGNAIQQKKFLTYQILGRRREGYESQQCGAGKRQNTARK